MLARLGLVAALLAWGCGGSPARNHDGGESSDAPIAHEDAAPADASDAARALDAADAPPAADAADAAGMDAADAAGTDAADAAPPGDGGNEVGAGDGLSLFIPVDKAVANGWSMIPIAVRGSASQVPPGTELTFSVSRAGAGILRPRVLTAGGAEPQLYFTPCDGVATPSCLGPVTISVVRSSAPDVVLAQSAPLTLTTDPDVGSPAACLYGDNALFLDGAARDVLVGTTLVQQGTFDPTGAARPLIKLGVNPAGVAKPSFGAYWNISLGSTTSMTDLVAGIYRKSAGATVPFTITRTNVSSGCTAGDFQILDVAWAGNQLERFLATFDLACSPIGSTLRGCVRFSAQ